jgi:hypothetical protein
MAGRRKGFHRGHNSSDAGHWTRIVTPQLPWLVSLQEEMQMVTKDACASEAVYQPKNLLLLVDQSIGWLPTLLHLLTSLTQARSKKELSEPKSVPEPPFWPGCNLIFLECDKKSKKSYSED